MAAMSRPGTIYNTSPLPMLVNGLVVASGHDIHVDDIHGADITHRTGGEPYIVPDDAEPSPRAEDDASPATTADATGPADDGKPAKAHRTRKQAPEAAHEENPTP